MTIFEDEYKKLFIEAARLRLKNLHIANVLTKDTIKDLPVCVRNYLYFTGNVDKPFVSNIHITANGLLKSSENGSWLKITSDQYNFFDDPARLYYINSSLFGLPFSGLHSYTEKGATMKIKVAGLFKVVDAKGDKMDQGETVTMFNDMVMYAPATLISPAITWNEIDNMTVEAIFRNQNNKVTAKLYFNSDGALTNFISNDRYLSLDGKTYTQYPWETPISDYREYEGRKVASSGSAVWKKPSGDYTYIKISVKNIRHNVCEVI